MTFASPGWPSLPASKRESGKGMVGEEKQPSMGKGRGQLEDPGPLLPVPCRSPPSPPHTHLGSCCPHRSSPTSPAGGSGRARSSRGTTTTRWAAWKARSCSAAAGPSSAGGVCSSTQPRPAPLLSCPALRTWVFPTVELWAPSLQSRYCPSSWPTGVGVPGQETPSTWC